MATAALGVAVLSLPIFSTISNRFLSMLLTFTGQNTGSGTFVDYSSIDRFHMFFNGVEMMLRKPLFGYGFHGFHNYSSFGHAWSHNNFSETLACFGVLGAVLYFYPFVMSSIGAFKIITRNKKELIFGLVLLFFFSCMFSFAFDVQKLFSYTIGIVYAAMSDSKNILIIKPSEIFKKKMVIQK